MTRKRRNIQAKRRRHQVRPVPTLDQQITAEVYDSLGSPRFLLKPWEIIALLAVVGVSQFGLAFGMGWL